MTTVFCEVLTIRKSIFSIKTMRENTTHILKTLIIPFRISLLLTGLFPLGYINLILLRRLYMSDYISKWHKELDIFSKIKPLLILEGNILDSYQYPIEGSTPKGSILRLTEYLHYFYKDMGYKNIIFYDIFN